VQVGKAGPIEWWRLPASDCLRLERRGPGEIFFEIDVNEASGPSCSAAGTARRQRDTTEFEAEFEALGDEGIGCRVRLRLSPAEIMLEGLTSECRYFCGAGAVLEAALRSDRRARNERRV